MPSPVDCVSDCELLGRNEVRLSCWYKDLQQWPTGAWAGSYRQERTLYWGNPCSENLPCQNHPQVSTLHLTHFDSTNTFNIFPLAGASLVVDSDETVSVLIGCLRIVVPHAMGKTELVAVYSLWHDTFHQLKVT